MLWGMVALIIVDVDPVLLRDVWIEGIYLPFLLSVLLSLWYTFALVLKSYLRSLLISLLMVLMIALSILKVLNLISAMAILISTLLIIYSTLHKRTKNNLTSTD